MMKLNRNFVTPFISLAFLAVGLSGILMFFHWLDGFTEVVHETLGLFFIICAIFHIILNWKALRIHFKKGVFIPALLSVLIVSGFLVVAETIYPPVDLVVINKIIRAPIRDAFKVLDANYEEASKRLKNKGILIGEACTIGEIWIKNNADPEEVIDLIME